MLEKKMFCFMCDTLFMKLLQQIVPSYNACNLNLEALYRQFNTFNLILNLSGATSSEIPAYSE